MFSSDDINKGKLKMFRNFTDTDDVELQSTSTENLDWQYNRMVLIGELEWVKGMIRRLHAVGIAEASTWSRIVPTGKPDEVISTLLRPRRLR